MSAISKSYNRVHNVFEHIDILPNVCFTTSETERDCFE